MPYGWRVARAWVLGFLLAALWWWFISWRVWPDHYLGTLNFYEQNRLPAATLLLLCIGGLVFSPHGTNLLKFVWRSQFLWLQIVVALIGVAILIPGAHGLYTIGEATIRNVGVVVSGEPGYRYEESENLRLGRSSHRITLVKQIDGSYIRRYEDWDNYHPSTPPEISETKLHGSPRVQTTTDRLGALANILVNGGPPLVLLLVPVWATHLREKLSEHPYLRSLFLSGRGGSARWAGPTSLMKHERWGDNGVFLGSSTFDNDFAGREIAIRDDSHMLTIGAPGSGKSVTSIWPNLLTYQGPVIVIDPKGEHAKTTLGRRQQRYSEELMAKRRHDTSVDAELLRQYGTYTNDRSYTKPIPGSRSWVLDPYGIVSCYQSARYNVLSEIDLNDLHARSMISAISRSCITVGDSENKFWEESACQVLDGAIAHVLSTFPEDRRTLSEVADLLLGVDAQTGFADPNRLRETLIDMRMNPAAGGLPQRAAMLFDNLGEKAYGNVTAELLNALKWCTDPAMRTNLAASDFTFDQICSGGINSVYIAIPLGAMKEQDRWLRCVSEIAMQSAIRRREQSPRPDPPVLFVLDELPQYGMKLNGIKEGVVTLRDAGIKLWAFVQNYSQLVECFGEEGATNFESGSTIQVYGVYDTKTAEWISAKLGAHGIKRKSWQRIWILFLPITVKREETQLVEASEITQELQKGSRLQYVFPGLGRPMRLQRKPFKDLEIDGTRFRKMRGCPAADEHLRA